MSRRIISLIAAVMLLCCIPMAAQAREVPQLKDGTITFTVRSGNENINGGTLRLYRVGNIVEKDNNYSFELITELADTNVDVSNTSSPSVAKTLAAKVKALKLSYLSADIKDGKAYFASVSHGLYVVVQVSAAKGYERMDPFLISMPQFQDGSYTNHVSVYPKVPIETQPPETTTTTTPTTLPSSAPQTGQLKWPVPILAVMGLALLGFGFVLRGRKKDSYEG